VNSIEKLKLTRKSKYVRDAFLVGCYTGLRISDIKTLKNEDIRDGWICKKMIKTNKNVMIPYSKLFDNKFQDIMDRYGNNIDRLTKHIGQTGAANQILKKIFEEAKIIDYAERNITFHTSRHTFASLLLEEGVQISTISSMLGHTKLSTTAIYAETTQKTILNDLKKNKKK
jgi:integrase